MEKLTRRDFLRTMGSAAFAAALPGKGWLQEEEPAPPPPVTHWDGSPYGRILLNVMTVYNEPDWRSGATGDYYSWNDVVPVLEARGGAGLYSTNHTWLRTEHGWIYSSWVQPVTNNAANPAAAVGEGGLWAEVTVPYTTIIKDPFREEPLYGYEKMYCHTVHRVVGVEGGYYKIQETYGYEYWLPAAHLRIVPPEALAPLSPQVPGDQKRVEVSIGSEMLYAYEGEALVFQSPVATGVPATPTPWGEYRIYLKRHGQRMTGGASDSYYNLPGIPYVAYFTRTYAALHGTYWHNDYGRRHSNGCVNLRPEAAQWLFRWTLPVADYFAFSTYGHAVENPGTPVMVGW